MSGRVAARRPPVIAEITRLGSVVAGLPVMTLERDHRWAIVLAGGDGTRLASLTAALYGRPLPKQFAALDGPRSMLQATLGRVEQIISSDHIVVVVGPAHAELARSQLSAFPGVALLVQPASLGTAIAILYGLAWVRVRDRDADVVVFPSDHYVADERGFVGAAAAAADACRSLEQLVLIGATPDSADPEYGWIAPGTERGSGLFAVDHFVEKPGHADAERLRRDGALWNTFVFAASATILASLARVHLPATAARFDAWACGDVSIAEAFGDSPAADFSRDVLQHGSELAVLAMPNVGWSDWGTPDRVLASLRGKPAGRYLRARIASAASASAVA